MCCGDPEVLDLPAPAIEALAWYRRLCDERGWDWGGEALPELFRYARFSRFGPLLEAVGDTGGDWAAALRTVVGGDPPAGVVVVHIDASSVPGVTAGPRRVTIAGTTVPVHVVVDSVADTDLRVRVGGNDVSVAAGAAALQTVDVNGADPTLTIAVGDATVEVADAVRTVDSAQLRLTSSACARWSVTDATGGGWFPDGAVRKWDVHHRPFFHSHDAIVTVPAVPLEVRCGRGIEYASTSVEVRPEPGTLLAVALEPQRRFDPTASGWYGGDLHVHLNYSGDLVCAPDDAARMQRGEGLHLLQLTAGNLSTSLVYDRELFETTAGRDLPWSDDTTVARAGVEFRNDLLGHVHALGASGPPTRYYTGHEGTDDPDDWPPNIVACRELAGLDAIVGYAHPAFSAFGDDWSTEAFFANPRSVEARELVVDAALGAVDSVDVISPFDDEAATFLYHRLLSCGLRLAATAGTDAFLSFSHGPGVASNPPGWGRVYADLDGQELSVAAFTDAVRAGRTAVTNGPWITLDVDGHRPGAVLGRAPGDALTLTATTDELADSLTLVGPDGVIAETTDGRLDVDVVADEPLWLAAVVRGPGHPDVLDARAFAHTSPVHVEVHGRRVARRADAAWCLNLLDTFEAFVAEHGRFTPERRADRLGDHYHAIEQARAFYRAVHERATR